MERQHSALTAVLPLSAHAVRGHTGALELSADQPGDQVVLEEDTFIIQEDGGIIPVPAGTVATLLPDSEDETTDVKLPVLNPSEPASSDKSQATVPDKHSNYNCLGDSELPAVEPLKTDCLGSSEIAVTISNPSVLNDNSKEGVSCTEPSAEVNPIEDSSTVALAENMSNNATVQEKLLPSAENVDATASDLYVQEEEEVILDHNSTDINMSTSELSSVETKSVLTTSKLNSEEPVQNKTNKKSAPKDGKQSDTSNLEKSKVTESPGAQTLSKFTSTEKNTVVTPAVSASGRPQRSTPRRSAIDLLKGSDVKPVRRAPTEHDIDGPPAKIPKQVLTKKNTDTNVSLEEKSSTDITVSRGRPRRKVTDATEVVDDGQTLRKSKISFTEESSCDSSGTFNSDAVENGKLKLMPNTSTLKDVSAKLNEIPETDKDELVGPKIAFENLVAEPVAVNLSLGEITSPDPSRLHAHPRRKVSDAAAVPSKVSQAETFNNSDKCEIVKNCKQRGSESSALSDSICAETTFDDEIKEKIEVDNKKTKTQPLSKESSNSSVRGVSKKVDTLKTNLLGSYPATANGSNKEVQDNVDSVTGLSAQRCLRRKPIAQSDQKSSTTIVPIAVHEDHDELSQDKEEFDPVKVDLKQRIGILKESEASRLEDNSGLPGFPYHSFTESSPIKNIAEVKSRIKSTKIRHRKVKLVNEIGIGRETHSDVLEMSRAKFPNVESMQARIRELEEEVDKLQLMLREGKSENGSSGGKSTGYSMHKDTVVSQDLSLDQKSELDRKEKKLRHLDRELDEKRTELTIKLACITRYERQVLEKERRLKKLEASLNLRTRPLQDLEDSTKDTISIKETPLLMTGRVDLHAEEHKLELRRQELERQSTFLEDEKKKLVAKERELETREQAAEQAAEHAAVDADLLSMASVFKSNDQTCSSTVKHSNGKISVEFSDDEDDSFAIDPHRFDSAFAAVVGFPTPVALPGSNRFTDDDKETSPIRISSAKKKYTEDNSFSPNSSSDSSSSETFVKRRCVETEENSAKENPML